MNKLVLASLLLIFGGNALAQAESAENCPCLHLTKKPKNPVHPQNVVIMQDQYIAPAKTSAVLPVAQPIQVVKPAEKVQAAPQSVAAMKAEPKKAKTETAKPADVASESHTNTAEDKNPGPFYLGLSSGAHYGDISSSSVSPTYHFTGRIYGGYQATDNFSVELGYFRVRSELISEYSVEKDSYNTTRNTNLLKAHRHGFDLLGVFKSKEMIPGLYGKVGIAYERVNFKDTLISAVTGIPARDRTGKGGILSYGDKTISVLASRSLKDNADYVLGFGYELNLTNHIMMNVDFTRYQPIRDEVKKPVNYLSLGLKYQF